MRKGGENMEVIFNYGRLKELRKKKKFSQFRLAELSGTTDRYIRFMEQGKKTNPFAIILYRVCRALGCAVEYVMDSGTDTGENGNS